MNIFLFSCVFPPEPVVSAKTSEDIALHLHSLGHNVRVYCPKPNRNLNKFASADYSIYPFIVKNLNTIKSSNSGMISRFLENISFGFSSFFTILFSRKIDVVYANTWPVFSSFLIMVASKIRQIKLVISIQDIYPETLVSQNKIKEDSFLFKSILFLDKLTAINSSKVIVISSYFKDLYLIKRNVLQENILIVSNWQDSSLFSSLPMYESKAEISTILKYDMNNVKLCVYGGNIGLASGVLELVREWIVSGTDMHLLIAGSGSQLPEIQALLAQFNCQNIHLISPWPKELTSLVYSCSDILLLPISKGQESYSVPSKLIGYMFSAKPIAMSSFSPSQASKDLDASGGGLIFKTFDADSIKLISEFLKNTPQSKIDGMGKNNFEYALKNYDKNKSLSIIANVIQEK